MLILLCGIMRSGKTLTATAISKEYRDNNKNDKIYANYHLKLKNFIYTPFFILPFSELHDCLIIADDFFALKNSQALLETIVLLSGKNDITVILTSQYYSDFIPKIRVLANKFGFCLYLKEKDLLLVDYSHRENNERNPFDFMFEQECNLFQFEKAVETLKDLYDTKEPVKVSTDNLIIREIINMCDNLDDIDVNVSNCFKSISKREKILNKIIKEKGIKI